jgi:VWFA-related protein
LDEETAKKVTRVMMLKRKDFALVRVCVVAVLGACVSPVFLAQTPPMPPSAPQKGTDTSAGHTATLHVTTKLVVLDVVVLDKSNHPVATLTKDDFSITENKVPQTIRTFDPPISHAMPAGSNEHAIVHGTADLKKICTAPVNILVFDELNTSWEATAYARMQMEDYLKAQSEPMLVPTELVAAGSDNRFIVLHDYTQSRQDLLDAVKKYWPRYPYEMMRGNSGNTQIELMEETLGVLSQLAESSRGTPGHKNVIWVGSGYPSINTQTLVFDDEDKLREIIRRVVDRMLQARMALYLVDPKGVQSVETDGGAADDDGGAVQTIGSVVGPFEGDLDFATFAPATGGEIFANRNDIDIAIAESVQDGGVYYTMSYVPTGTGDEPFKYKQIVIKLKNPNLHAVTRDGYFPEASTVDVVPTAKGEKASNQLQFDIVSAARTKLVYNGLDVQVKSEDQGYQLLVGAKGLHWERQQDGSQLAEVTVMTTFFSMKDKELKSQALQLKERIGGDVVTQGSARVAFHIPIHGPEAATRVRFVVRDAASGVLGTADFDH